MSQSIDLEFIQQPLFSLSRFAWLRLIVLAIGLLAVAITWQAHHNQKIEMAKLESELNQFKQVKQIQPSVSQAVVAIAPEKIKELLDMLNVLATPWSGLFEAIEDTGNKDVVLLSLEPSTKKQQVLMMGEAKNLQVALQYVAQLQKQSVLTQVFMQKHHVDESNVSKPVRFTVLAKWETVL